MKSKHSSRFAVLTDKNLWIFSCNFITDTTTRCRLGRSPRSVPYFYFYDDDYNPAPSMVEDLGKIEKYLGKALSLIHI